MTKPTPETNESARSRPLTKKGHNKMKHEIDIRNGSGWNHYAALRELTTLPRGTRGLMADNKVARLTISPYDSERPFGIAARFYDSEGEEIYCLSFDQNDRAEWIAARVKLLLEEGITNRKNAVAAARAKDELVAANAAGFATAEEHRASIAAEEGRVRAEAEAKRKAMLADTANATAALNEMRDLRASHPEAVRMTRKMDLFDANEAAVATFGNWPGALAWLHQNGFRASVDDREHFFAAAK